VNQFMRLSFQSHPHFIKGVEVSRQRDPRGDRQPVFGRVGIEDLSNDNVLRKNPAFTAGPDQLSWFEVFGPGQKPHFDDIRMHGAGGPDNPRVASFVVDASGDFAIGIAEQDDVRAGEADRVHAPDQEPLRAQHRQVVAEAIAAAKINLDIAPPIRGFAQHDVSEFEFPFLVLLPGQVLAQARIFPEHLLQLQGLQLEFLVFAPQELVLFE
jgi:hypothetical protein